MLPDPRHGSKFIYVVRNGRDVVLSFYKHLSNQAVDDGGITCSFEQFFSQWIEGALPYGSWTDHLSVWSKCLNNPLYDILLVSFEDMKHDLLGEMCRVARHLELDLTREEIQRDCVPKVTFAYMKAHQEKFAPQSVKWRKAKKDEEAFTFIRKGRVGDGRAFLSNANNESFDKFAARPGFREAIKYLPQSGGRLIS
eukprot:g2991.t1